MRAMYIYRVNVSYSRMKINQTVVYFFSLILFSISDINAQITTHWVEDFSAPSSQATPAIGYNGWTVTNNGVNGTDANIWYVSCEENGNLIGQCGTGCAGNATLHIGSQPVPILCPTGDCGAAYNAGGGPYNTFTHKIAVTPTIDCSCSGDPVYVDLRYLANGQNNQDYCSFEYWDGAAWTVITQLSPTMNAPCPPQGQWTFYSVALPSTAVNNPNVKLGFYWQNNNDGLGTDPSIAVDSIVVYSQPISYFADFTWNPTSPCFGDSITFTNNTFGPATNFSWDFGGGGSPNTSTLQNPSSLFSTAGNYVVTLTVSDNCGTPSSSNSYLIIVNNCISAVADFTASQTQFCQGDSVLFTDASLGSPTSFEWSFPGGIPSSYLGQNPPYIVYNTIGMYDVTLIVTNGFGSDTLTMVNYINTINCTLPTANFSTPSTSICNGTCIDFTDLSTGNGLVGWTWTFPGATPTSSFNQNPTNICYNAPGSYDVTLTVDDGANIDTYTLTNYITVNNCQPPTALFNANSTAICATQCVTYTSQSLLANTYSWSFPGGIPANFIGQNPPQICYGSSGTYDAELIVSNIYGIDTLLQTSYIIVSDCTPTASFSATLTSGCNGDCFSFLNQSNGATSWNWQFPGGNPSTFSGQNPPQICYTNPGNYDITLVVSNSYGIDSVIQISFITIIYCNNLHANFSASDTSICAGDCISFANLSTGAPIGWQWILPGGNPDTITTQNPPYVCYPNAGIFPVTLIVFNIGGSDTLIKTGYITVNTGTPISTNIDSTTIFAGTAIQLIASGGVSYSWDYGISLDNDSISSPVATPYDTTNYTVTMFDFNGCSSTKSILINVIPPETVWAPNAFTPNNDKNNDIFYLRPGGIIINYELRIFDRWGEMLFESKDPTAGWDGTFLNTKLNVGVYVYYYKIEFIDGAVLENSGDVTLLR